MNLADLTGAGRKVQAVFAFVDIRNFSAITEALQGSVSKDLN